MKAVFADTSFFLASLNPDDELHNKAIALSRQVSAPRRKDKDWSLTDCISFIVMSDVGISEALTHDHHFEQAGFSALLR